MKTIYLVKLVSYTPALDKNMMAVEDVVAAFSSYEAAADYIEDVQTTLDEWYDICPMEVFDSLAERKSYGNESINTDCHDNRQE